jgi:ribosomal RNA assembly protein
MVKAIGRGFTADQALKLASDDMFLEIIPLKPIIGDKINHIKRVRSRLIGTKGRTRKALEELTKVNIMILGSTVSLIGTYENITTSKSSLMEIIKGAKIESVIGKLEDSKNKNKKSENILWKNEDEATENTEDEVIDPFQDYKEE